MTVERSMGLFRATAVGVGSIVGGGILALAGVSFAEAGPAAVLAFVLNGVIALVTVTSFAELSTRFPESGGTYAFARKVLAIEAAFIIGWIFWFALIASAALYAVGFAEFAAIGAASLLTGVGAEVPNWLDSRVAVIAVALLPTMLYTATFMRRSAAGGPWINVGKVVVYSVLIAAGLWVIVRDPEVSVASRMVPFMPHGWTGVLHVMGLTFITLHGFDLVAAVGGEIESPERNIPRAMMLSLVVALAIYIPLLLVVAVAGLAPGETLSVAAGSNPEAMVARAARQYMGGLGYWLVVVAALLSLLSALQANLFAATRVAYAMARDRTLPHGLQRTHARRGTPTVAVLATAAIVAAVIVILPDVASSGAAASLIFLITFALTHWIAVLARGRGAVPTGAFRTPLFPVTPVVGGLACVALAIFEGVAVPSAGIITAAWLTIGGALFLSLFARRARVFDATSEAIDPQLVRLRGRRPLVLVPIANPHNAEAMVEVAGALAPRDVGRVLLLCVVPAPNGWDPAHTPEALANAQEVLGETLTASFPSGVAPEALTTIAKEPWTEIARIARTHDCESMLLGLGRLEEAADGTRLGAMITSVACDVVLLRAAAGWRLDQVRRVVVPLGGRGDHDLLRARLLGSLHRMGVRAITFVGVLPQDADDEIEARMRRDLLRSAVDESSEGSTVEILRGDDVVDALVEYVRDDDLVVLGLQRVERRRTALGRVAMDVARRAQFPLIMISRHA